MKALLVILLLSAPAAAETLRRTVAGRERWALVREPATGKAPRPLIILLHGGGGNPTQAEAAYGMTEAAAAEGFLVAYPAGTNRLFPRRLLTWNAGNCCGYAKEKAVDDVAFLAALVEKLVRDGRADPKRVFVTGMSNGAMMAHRFACERADLVAAIAPVAGTMAVADCQPSRPVSVLMINGRADQHVPFKGGEGTQSSSPRVDRSFDETWKVWHEAGDCTVSGVGDGETSRRSESCRDGTVLAGVVHPGGHVWPGSKQPQYRGADPMLPEPKTTALIVDFFRKHGR